MLSIFSYACWCIDHLSFDYFPLLMLRIWKFWNTNEFLVLLRIEFWEDDVAGITESIFGVVPRVILVLREKNGREHSLNWGVERTHFQNTAPLTNTFMRETFPLPHNFLLHLLLLLNCRFLHAVISPWKWYEKYFQSSEHNQICRFLTSSVRHLNLIPCFLWVESYKG